MEMQAPHLGPLRHGPEPAGRRPERAKGGVTWTSGPHGYHKRRESLPFGPTTVQMPDRQQGWLLV
jgi:hypothetical protein